MKLTPNFLHQKWFNNIIALLAGALLTLAFAPFELFPLAILAPALLLATWLNATPKQNFCRGWLFGIGLFGTGVYWVFISINTFGNVSIFLAGFITIGFIALLALFPAICGYLFSRYFPILNATKILFAFPALWVLFEWIRSWIFSGFPWLLIGTSQINSPLAGYAPIFSVFGVSLATIFTSSLIVFSITEFKNKSHKHLYFNLYRFALLWLVGAALCFIAWTKPQGDPIQVSLVQGNIQQELKWSPDQIQPTLDRYEALTNQHWDSKIIIWPESAIPIPLQNAEDFVKKMAEQATAHHVALITGIPIHVPEKNGYYNAVIALGEGRGYYTKLRLVPFGEYIPFRDELGRLLALIDVPMSDFISGENNKHWITVNDINIASFVCYEIAFPEQVVSPDPNINLLLTVSNDAWFGESIAQAQHLEMAQMRALEMGRPVLFVSNNGLTAILDAHGNIQSIAPPYVTDVLTDKVQPMKGKTPWQKTFLDPVLFLLLIMLFTAIGKQRLALKKRQLDA